jgi:hypothetical protein
MYKEKYIKYKTKYLELKSQLDSGPNIIQEGGGPKWWPFGNEKPADVERAAVTGNNHDTDIEKRKKL